MNCWTQMKLHSFVTIFQPSGIHIAGGIDVLVIQVSSKLAETVFCLISSCYVECKTGQNGFSYKNHAISCELNFVVVLYLKKQKFFISNRLCLVINYFPYIAKFLHAELCAYQTNMERSFRFSGKRNMLMTSCYKWLKSTLRR